MHATIFRLAGLNRNAQVRKRRAGGFGAVRAYPGNQEILLLGGDQNAHAMFVRQTSQAE